MSPSVPLLEIQKLQFSDKSKAERCLLGFLQEHEDPSIAQVELLPKPESLNSINGFVTYSNNERYFFKSHVEENEQLGEYYNAKTLADAGYPVIAAKQIEHRPGKQIVLYEIVSLPTLFDLLKNEEDELLKGNPASTSSRLLLGAQMELDKKVAEIYRATLRRISTADDARAPIHQLFSHRLADQGRLGLFYKGKHLNLNNGSISFEELAQVHWTINGARYDQTLAEIIDRSRSLLEPSATMAVVGHGDAHNGNIFFDSTKDALVMFDPAFAGLHSPLLDLTKPLFHNVFARWMYYPEQVLSEFNLTYAISGNEIKIEHSFKPTSLRVDFLRSRIRHVLTATVSLLRDEKSLPNDWPDYLRSSLFCCPFLTVNLFAPYIARGTLAERYELPIKLLGLSMAIELGASVRTGSNALADLIDEIFA